MSSVHNNSTSLSQGDTTPSVDQGQARVHTAAAGDLHRATENASLADIKRLLQGGADVNGQDTNGKTPLHLARTNVVAECLLAHGAEVNAPNHCGYTPLHSAVRTGRADVVQVLLDHGADVNARAHPYRLTPLHLAVDDGRFEIAEILLAKAVDLPA